MKYKDFLYLVCMISQFGCTEKYNPTVSTVTDVIVVQGLVTNSKEPYIVKISKATPYDSGVNQALLQAKSVSIRDNLGNTYPLQYNLSYYYTDSSQFTAVPGRLYTLHVEMPGGDIFESSAQKLLLPASIDSIYGYYDKQYQYYYNAAGIMIIDSVYAPDTYVDVSYPSDSIVQFRFENMVTQCYIYNYWYTETMQEEGVPFPLPLNGGCPYNYCGYNVFAWQRTDLNFSTINLSAMTRSMVQNKINKMSAGFGVGNSINFKTDSINNFGDDLGVVRIFDISENPVLSIRIYSLNKASSIYYQEVTAQLSSEGKLFDPVNVQLQGNMKCINNSAKQVLGFFEVSGSVTQSYIITNNYYSSQQQIVYTPQPNIYYNMPNGFTQVTPPTWWPFK